MRHAHRFMSVEWFVDDKAEANVTCASRGVQTTREGVTNMVTPSVEIASPYELRATHGLVDALGPLVG